LFHHFDQLPGQVLDLKFKQPVNEGDGPVLDLTICLPTEQQAAAAMDSSLAAVCSAAVATRVRIWSFQPGLKARNKSASSSENKNLRIFSSMPDSVAGKPGVLVKPLLKLTKTSSDIKLPPFPGVALRY
jgi:hypothetical protein